MKKLDAQAGSDGQQNQWIWTDRKSLRAEPSFRVSLGIYLL